MAGPVAAPFAKQAGRTCAGLIARGSLTFAGRFGALTLAAFLLVAPAGWAHEARVARFAELGGTVIFESVSPEVTEATPFAVASIGKLVTSVAVLRLAERGLIDLNGRVSDMVPDAFLDLVQGLERITPYHLLTMTAGLPDYYDDAYLRDALDDPVGVQTPLVALESLEGSAPLFAPGTRFDYSNTNYVLLGVILEQATGQSYATNALEQVLGPAGMQDSFVFGARALPEDFVTGHSDGVHVRGYYTGQGMGDGGVIASARDLAAFYTALFTERRLLGRASMAVLLNDPVGAGYGAGVEIEGDVVGHSGGDYGFAADIRMDLVGGDVAVILVGDEDGETDWALDAILARMSR